MALLYLLTVYSHFDVWAPEELTGNWADVPAVYAPAEYQINGRVALATTCPCSWLNATAGSLGTGLTDMLLLVPDSICPPACSGELTACAANFHNASGMLISERFNMPLAPPSPPQTAPSPPPPTSAIQDVVDAQRAIIQNTADRLGCSSSLPTSVIQSNMSTYLHEGVSWNYTLLPQAAYGLPASPSVSSDVLAVDTTSVAINLTIYRQPEEGKMDCTKYRWVPLVYVIFVPIWLMLTIAWTWNTYYKNYQYSRDLHRLMCWVPVMEFIHGLLSLFNYFSCPWEVRTPLPITLPLYHHHTTPFSSHSRTSPFPVACTLYAKTSSPSSPSYTPPSGPSSPS